MAVRKLSVALDEDVAAAARAAAEAAGMSLSAWLSEAARSRLRVADGLAAMREWDEVAGPVSEAEQQQAAVWADRLLADQHPTDDVA